MAWAVGNPVEAVGKMAGEAASAAVDTTVDMAKNIAEIPVNMADQFSQGASSEALQAGGTLAEAGMQFAGNVSSGQLSNLAAPSTPAVGQAVGGPEVG